MREVKDRILAMFIRVVERRYPGSRVVLERFGCPDDPDVRWWLSVLNVPRKRIVECDEFMTRYTLKLHDYWKKPIRFLADAVSPEETAKYFPDAMQAPRSHRLVLRQGEVHSMVPDRKNRRRRAG